MSNWAQEHLIKAANRQAWWRRLRALEPLIEKAPSTAPRPYRQITKKTPKSLIQAALRDRETYMRSGGIKGKWEARKK